MCYREDKLFHNTRLCVLIVYCKYLGMIWPWWSCLLFCLLGLSPFHSPIFVAPSGKRGEGEEVGLVEYKHVFTWAKVIFLRKITWTVFLDSPSLCGILYLPSQGLHYLSFTVKTQLAQDAHLYLPFSNYQTSISDFAS